MKSVAAVNCYLPSVEHRLSYHSGASLVDYDICVFSPSFPQFRTESFTNGGYCVSIESSKRLSESMSHWRQEIIATIGRGNTVFVLLDEVESENFATGTSSKRKGEVTYHTQTVTNYGALPGDLKARNSKGRKVTASDPLFKALLGHLGDIVEYRVILDNPNVKTGFVARDGSQLGGVAQLKERTGHLVLVPFFEFSGDAFWKNSKWTVGAIAKSKGIIQQFVEIDKALKSVGVEEPAPDWALEAPLPNTAVTITDQISQIDAQISELQARRDSLSLALVEHANLRLLLYGTGKTLEGQVARAFKLMGYKVENLAVGDLEIDHVIESPEGFRMIGEAEGKDSSAVSITKFRQLESNINEDFAREETETPAKGVLIGNGYRLTKPEERPTEFTEKCLTNAARLRTALIRSSDLYRVAVHLIDNPFDEDFKRQCRNCIERSAGGIVTFPAG